MIKLLSVTLMAFLPILSAVADDDCLEHKITPRIDIENFEWVKNISQPDDYMTEHGHVQTSLIQENSVNVNLVSVKGGWCVVLKSVDTKIGYKEFNVEVDKKYKPDSCFYDAILVHEDKHIDVHLSVLDNYKQNLYDTIYGAANSVVPVFIDDIEMVNDAIDEIGNQLTTHPDVVLMMQRINAELDIQNSKIDLDEDGAEMQRCLDKVLNKN